VNASINLGRKTKMLGMARAVGLFKNALSLENNQSVSSLNFILPSIYLILAQPLEKYNPIFLRSGTL
jgi:hypothetical protein